MHTVTVSTSLDAPAEIVWRTATTPAAFTHVAGRMLRYPAAARLTEPWHPGQEIRGWTFLLGVIPFSVHHLRVTSIDHDNRELVSDERGGLVRRWHHEIAVDTLGDDRTRYTDRIEIDAGPATPIVAGFAHLFYRYRQRRWRGLAPLLAAAAG
jgi:hypothetical protein